MKVLVVYGEDKKKSLSKPVVDTWRIKKPQKKTELSNDIQFFLDEIKSFCKNQRISAVPT